MNGSGVNVLKNEWTNEKHRPKEMNVRVIGAFSRG